MTRSFGTPAWCRGLLLQAGRLQAVENFNAGPEQVLATVGSPTMPLQC
jgi:hypothetical protein